MQLQVIRDPMRPPPTREPQRDDAPLGRARQLVRGRQRLRAAVRQRQPGPTPIHPPFRCRWRALKPLRSTAKRPSITSYQQGKTPAPLRSQRSISVSHGDLRFRDASVVTHILAGGLLYVTCSQPLGEVHLTHRRVAPCSVSAFCNAQHTTGDLEADALPGRGWDDREPPFGRILSYFRIDVARRFTESTCFSSRTRRRASLANSEASVLPMPGSSPASMRSWRHHRQIVADAMPKSAASPLASRTSWTARARAHCTGISTDEA